MWFQFSDSSKYEFLLLKFPQASQLKNYNDEI